MSGYTSGYVPSAVGPKHPERYPFVGPAYNEFGEQSGWIYDPYSDRYRPDPKVQRQIQEQQGLVEKQPGMTDLLLPVAGVAGAAALGKELAPEIIPAAKGLLGEATGALGLGGSTTAATEGLSASAPLTQEGINAFGGVGNAAYGPQEAGLLSPGTAGGNLLGGAGVALGGWQAYEGIKNKNPLQAGLGGVGMGLGLNQLGLALGPWGWAAAVGAPVALGLLGGLGDKDMWETERKSLQALQDRGTYIPPGLIESMPTRGRSKAELVQIAKETGGNVKFAESRNEADLTGIDLANYSAFAEQDSNWFNRPVEERIAIGDKALQNGAIREHHGTIDIDTKKFRFNSETGQWEPITNANSQT